MVPVNHQKKNKMPKKYINVFFTKPLDIAEAETILKSFGLVIGFAYPEQKPKFCTVEFTPGSENHYKEKLEKHPKIKRVEHPPMRKLY